MIVLIPMALGLVLCVATVFAASIKMREAFDLRWPQSLGRWLMLLIIATYIGGVIMASGCFVLMLEGKL